MLQILSSLTLGSRFDMDADAWILLSGQTGTFVSIKGTNEKGNDSVGKPTAGDLAFPIWSESNRDGSAGFTPDIAATGKVTIFYGKLRGVTDQFTGTPAVNELLYVDATGKLTTSAAGKNIAVAVCTKAKHSAVYLSKKFDAIEFVTI